MLPDKPTQLVLEPLPAVIAADVGPSRHCEYWFVIRARMSCWPHRNMLKRLEVPFQVLNCANRVNPLRISARQWLRRCANQLATCAWNNIAARHATDRLQFREPEAPYVDPASGENWGSTVSGFSAEREGWTGSGMAAETSGL